MNTKQYELSKELLTALVKTASAPSRGTLLPNGQYPNSIFGTQSLASNLNKYYQHLPKGLNTAVGNSQKAWDKTKGKYKMGTRDDMAGMYRNIPIAPIKDYGDGSTGYYDFFKDMVEVDAKDKYTQGSKEHELTHALHLRDEGLANKSNKKLNPAEKLVRAAKVQRMLMTEFKKAKLKKGAPFTDEYADYVSQKGEIAVRTAEARRRYAYIHGVDVTSPEIADKALDWFINADPKAYGEGLIEPNTQSDLKQLRLFLENPEYLRRMMPTTTQNNRARRTYAA